VNYSANRQTDKWTNK